MLELLLLLFFIAVFSWYLGRKSAQQNIKQIIDYYLPKKNIKKFNYFLYNNEDKILKLFINFFKDTDNSTIEICLNLCKTFCLKGEIDRVIKINNILMVSTLLTFEQKLLVIQQLGYDYMTAGLYDRAENMFIKLINKKAFAMNALVQLLKIYQITSEWLKAINIAEKLVQLGKKYYLIEIAHFYCELSLESIKKNNFINAISLLKKASIANINSTRAVIIFANILMIQKKYVNAIDQLKLVFYQNKEIINEILPMLKECYYFLGQINEWMEFLKNCVSQNISLTAELLLADVIEDKDGLEIAQNYVYYQFRQRPNIIMFHRLIKFYIKTTKENIIKDSFQIMYDLVAEKMCISYRYCCKKCGFSLYVFHWHCPSCKSWESIKPICGLYN